MPRKPELSATQLAASGLATVTATVGASYLGVAGTLWGAAFMSVASTAGVAVYKHYLEEGKKQVWEKTHTPEEVAETAADITRIDPTRTVVWPAGTHAGDPTEVIAGVRMEPGDPATQVLDAAGTTRWESTLEWLKRRWVMLAVSSAAVFAVVMGGVTVVEAIADKPVSSIVGATNDKGTSFGNVGGKSGSTPVDRPADRPTGERTESPENRPSEPANPDPTNRPSPPPTKQPTKPPTRPPTQPPVSPPVNKPPKKDPPKDDQGQVPAPRSGSQGQANSGGQ